MAKRAAKEPEVKKGECPTCRRLLSMHTSKELRACRGSTLPVSGSDGRDPAVAIPEADPPEPTPAPKPDLELFVNKAVCRRAACGREFVRKPAPGRPPVYCSPECRTLAAEEREAARAEAAVPQRVEPQHPKPTSPTRAPQVGVAFDEATLAELEQVAARQDRTLAQTVRFAVKLFLQAQR